MQNRRIVPSRDMIGKFIAIVLGLASLSPCKGIKCWYCLNENSNLECMQNGKLVQCAPSQTQCQNEMRFIANGRYMKITKGCKQGMGCDNHRRQNELRKESYQCEKRAVVDVCWCCCDSDNCNRGKVFCQDLQPKCDILTPPVNGMVSCRRNDGSLGTNCVYRCRRDYHLVGTAGTTCVRSFNGALWSSKPPTCQPVSCEATPTAPEHGSVSCNNSRFLRSTCRFSCEPGYILIGARSTICSHFGSWSNSVPICHKIKCRLLPRRSPNLVIKCTDSNNLGSTCSFSCRNPFELQGPPEIRCEVFEGRLYGRWTGIFQNCSRTTCPALRGSDMLSVACTNGNKIGSVCTYTCTSNTNMVLNGEIIPRQVTNVTCTNGGWSGPAPVCELITCPKLHSVSNSRTSCSGGINVGSTCEYRCLPGYRLVGDETITCQDVARSATGSWNKEPPVCVGESERLAGMCIDYGEVKNGVLLCLPARFGNGTHWLPNTVCSLQCNGELYSPIGERSAVTCTSTGWIGQVCCDRCLSSPRLDIIVILDSSYANEELWEVSKSFIHDFALHITENLRYKLNFYIIPYATSVDIESAVIAPDITFDNYEEIHSFTQSIPYAGKGDSNTGVALRYVNDVVLGGLERGSIPFVVIVTNRAPSDQTLAIAESQRLRDKRIHIRVVPLNDFFSADPGVNLNAFVALTGSEPNSVVDSDSVETFYEEATSGVENYAKYCDNRVSAC